MKRRSLRQRLPYLAVEMVAIVFSVLFALGVDAWRAGRADARLAERVLVTLRDEVEDNREEVARALAHHEPLVRQLLGGGLRLAALHVRDEGIDASSPEALERTLRPALRSMGIPLPRYLAVSGSAEQEYVFRFDESVFVARVEDDTLGIYGQQGIILRSAAIRNNAWAVAQATGATAHMNYAVVAALSDLDRLQRSHDATVTNILDILYAGGGSILAPLQDLVHTERALLEKYDALLALTGME